jgi:hypothetical protein
MALVVGTKWFHKIFQLISCIGFHELGLLARSLHKIFTSLSVLVSGLCLLHHNFYFAFSCYLPLTSLVWDIYIGVVILTQVVQWLRLAFSRRLNRVAVLSHLRTETDLVSETLGFIVSLEYRMMDKVPKPSDYKSTFVKHVFPICFIRYEYYV